MAHIQPPVWPELSDIDKASVLQFHHWCRDLGLARAAQHHPPVFRDHPDLIGLRGEDAVRHAVQCFPAAVTLGAAEKARLLAIIAGNQARIPTPAEPSWDDDEPGDQPHLTLAIVGGELWDAFAERFGGATGITVSPNLFDDWDISLQINPSNGQPMLTILHGDLDFDLPSDWRENPQWTAGWIHGVVTGCLTTSLPLDLD